MTNPAAGRKMIAVSDGAARESYFLGLILSRCGRSLYMAASVGSAGRSGMEAAALLSPDPAARPDPAAFPVWVTAFAKDGAAPDRSGFRRVVTYAVDCDGADFTARNVRPMPDGVIAFEIVGVGVIGRVRLKSDRAEDAEAALAAAAAAIAAGLPFASALEALNDSGPLSGRGNGA